jgi:hypothetical protein
MIAVIFEFTPATKGKFVSLQFWRHEEAVDARAQASADSLIFHSKVHG